MIDHSGEIRALNDKEANEAIQYLVYGYYVPSPGRNFEYFKSSNYLKYYRGASARVDDWIFYANCEDNNKLYRIQDNGENKAKIADIAPVGGIVSDGNYIYCRIQTVDGEKESPLYRIKIDGSEKTLICPLKGIGNISLINDDLYFYAENKDFKSYGIYKMKTNGKKLKQVLHGVTYNFSLINEK